MPCPPQSGQLFTTAERLPVITGTPSGEVAMPVGPHDFLGETDQAGASPHASCSVHAPRPMVTVIGPPSSSCAHYARASSGPTVVVSFSQPHLRSAPPPAPAGPMPVHPRLQRGLRGSPPLASDRGPLGLGPETSAHQRSGASGHPPGPAALPAPCPGPAGNGYDRQHYSRRSAAQSGGTLSRLLYSHTAQLLLWADSHNISLVPRHIPGKLNVVADHLSHCHQVLNSEWTLSLPVLHQVWHLWGQPHVDMFATANNARLPTFISPLLDPQAWRIDALSFTWTGLWIYLFPPFPLLLEVLRRVSLTHCQAILISPVWPSQPWFPLLLRLLVDLPRQLPPTRTLLRQLSSQVFHQDPLHLSLHVWHLSGPLSNERGFQRTWHSELLQHTACQHSLSMTASGDFSVTGLPSRVEIDPPPLLPN